MNREARSMNEAKPFASLSSTLLARKGQAKPAMRPQGFHMTHDASFQIDPYRPQDQDDLGWNDMGHDVAPVVLHPAVQSEPAPATPVVVRQQQELEQELASVLTPPAAPWAEPKPRARPGSNGKSAFTLRLDGERHLRLRLVCAVEHRSAQQIVTQALDEFLDRQPDNAALAGRSTK